ncbi:uncharacterized protein LOC131940935 [Physella acuta]|uniref:uncharacterized protein LOC131940935 n=1 Tax=Physella acuta TaxID=109671 RepID=UPI0027DE8804|nr:uncharacterized protein LOC131940935 [Physella acuta]XP_059155841.1 uncharacterized protein LOC131940935 [Physella acuta]
MWTQKKLLSVLCCLVIVTFVACVTNYSHIFGYLAGLTKVLEGSDRISKNDSIIKVSLLSSNDNLVSRLEELISNTVVKKSEAFTNPCDKTSAACTSSCPKPLSSNPKQRLLDILSSANLTLSSRELEDILSMAESIPESDVIILSASSSNHYNEMQAMFQNLHSVVFPLVENLTVVLFDIGLTREQRIKTEKNCRCKVVKFPSEKFPRHMKNNHCYSWKPVIIRATIEKSRKLLLYQDASVRWTKGIVDGMFRATTTGMQIFRYFGSSRIPIHTLKQTFDYFGEEPCAFDPFPEVAATLSMFRNDVFNRRAILEPWAKCALTSECMCPVEPQSVLSCGKPVANHRCHRFDQSALGMITAKIFSNDIHRVIAPDLDQNVQIKREDVAPNYFNK